MDALTFGSTILLRHLTFSEARKMPIKEFYLDKVPMLVNLLKVEDLKGASFNERRPCYIYKLL